MQQVQTLKKALNHHQAGRLDKAETMYKAMLKRNRTDGQLMHLLAIVADQQGRTGEAIDLLKASMEFDCPPDNVKTLATYLLKEKRYKEAEPIFKRAIALYPQDATIRGELGELYRNVERYEDQVAQYRAAIALNPRYVEAYNNLAVGLNSLGDTDGAIEAFRKAAEIGNGSMSWNNLGLLVFNKGHFEEALTYFEKAVAAQPDFGQAHNNIAVTLGKLGRNEEAYAQCQRAVEADPTCIEAHQNLVSGALLMQKPFDSLSSCLRLIQLRPDQATGYTKLALSLCEQGQYPEAVTAGYKAIECEPDNHEAYQAIIPSLTKMNRFDEALSASAKLLSLNPDNAATLCTVGLALAEAAHFDDALAMCGRAIELDPANHVYYHGLACVSHAAGRYPDAIAMCTRVLEMKPDYVLAQWDRSLMYLMMGDFQRGWDEFEIRWQTAQLRYDERKFDGAHWKGEDLTGKTIMLTAEQGLGDTIQFARYVPLLVERGAKVVMFIQPALRNLLSNVEGVSQLVCYGEQPPPFDYQCAMMSLPLRFGTLIDSVPFKQGYISVAAADREKWRQRVSGKAGLKVGLVWSGNPKHRNDRNRSMKLAQLQPLLDLPNISWFSLQVGHGEEQLADMTPGLIDNLRPELNDFTDTAAAISELDLVISVDTSTVHLAGAVGKPVWVMVPYVPDWRWLLDRRDNPWYEMLLVFRQDKHGNWASVVDDVRATLTAVLNADGLA